MAHPARMCRAAEGPRKWPPLTRIRGGLPTEDPLYKETDTLQETVAKENHYLLEGKLTHRNEYQRFSAITED